MTNYFTFIVQSSLIDEKHLVKFGQSDQMPVNLQISEFIAGRTNDESTPLHKHGRKQTNI